jgi:hypothetical protein
MTAKVGRGILVIVVTLVFDGYLNLYYHHKSDFTQTGFPCTVSRSSLAGKMTGFSSLPLVQEEGRDDQQKFRGVSRIVGPPWAHLPTITIGLLGVQIFWSVEMSYGACRYSISLTSRSKLSSFTVSVVTGSLEVEHGWSFRCWATFRVDYAAIDW